MSSSGTSSSNANATPASGSTSASTNRPAQQNVFFIHRTREDFTASSDDRTGVRAQAARASSNARLETIRKRAEGRARPSGQQVFSVNLPERSNDRRPRTRHEPLPRIAVEQHQNTMNQYRDREASVALHSHVQLGGSIPPAQAGFAIIQRFLDRFNLPNNSSYVERPWTTLVLSESSSAATSMTSMALQANATALSANDLQRPEIHNHATKLYVSTLTNLQSQLSSSTWHDSKVMYTCMIISLFEVIRTNDASASYPHVRAVGRLMQQKGPHSFVDGLEHRTFRYYRINLFMMNLADRQPTFLAEEQWKTIPFSRNDPPKTVLETLVDILVEIPGVLATTESLTNPELGTYTLLQKAFELAYWLRCLVYDLERWKENHIWTYPAISNTADLRRLNLLALCDLGTDLIPYDQKLAEALNCYAAAHLILARIGQGLAERSMIIRATIPLPYGLEDLVAAIALISERHISSVGTDMVSLMVTVFPLQVAQSTTEVERPDLLTTVNGLLKRINGEFAKRYNINYEPGETKRFQV